MIYYPIIDAGTVAAHLDDPRWRVVDCRFDLRDPDAGRRAYESGHIPGAVFAHLEQDLSSPKGPHTGRHPLPDPDALAKRSGQWGIGPDTQVVVYDDQNGLFAARLWWLLLWLGHQAVAVLDGGLNAWRREGRPLRAGVENAPAAPFERREPLVQYLTSEDILRRLTTPEFLLIDARAPERYRGDVEPIDPVAGHVPGAVNQPTSVNLGPDGHFLSPATLRARYQALLNGHRTEDVAVMCGSGVTACHDLIAMELAGFTGAQLYPGSWSEWIRDPSRPVAVGEQP